MFQKLLLIALAGAIGTLARYGLGGLVQEHAEQSGRMFPWGTVVVNLLGCLAFGIVWTSFSRWSIGGEMRTIVLVGFMGGFTTFSTFIFETNRLLGDAEWLPALAYFTMHNVGGLAAIAVGFAIGRLF
jgi:fluoride exporter